MKKRWLIGLVFCLCLLLLAGCADGETPANPDGGATTAPTAETRTQPVVVGYEYRFFTQKSSGSEEDRKGIMDSTGQVTCEPRFTSGRQLSSDRFEVNGTECPWLIVDEHGETIIEITDGWEVQDNICSWNLYQDEPEKRKDIPVRFYVNGYVYDEDGNILSEKYEKMRRADVDGRPLVWAQCDEGIFLLDENGQRIEQIDVVKTGDPLFDGAFIQTTREDFDFTRHGIRTADDAVILEERYRYVFALSADRFAGSDTVMVQSDDNRETQSVIVDGEGKVLCDRYNGLQFFPLDGPGSASGFYPFGVARRVDEDPNAQYMWYAVIDWDGNAVVEERATGYDMEDGVITLTLEDGGSVRYSATTGEKVE